MVPLSRAVNKHASREKTAFSKCQLNKMAVRYPVPAIWY